MAVRHRRPAALCPSGTASQPGHPGGRPGLVDEDQALGVEIGLRVEPSPAPRGDVGPLLLAGVRGLFLTVMACRSRQRQTVLGANEVPWSRRSMSASSTSVMSTWASIAARMTSR